MIYRTEHLPVRGGTCGHDHSSPESGSNTVDIAHLIKPLHQRVRRNVWSTTKYMELFIVADNTLYQKQNQDYSKTRQRIMEIANYVDKFYRALNIRVPLIGLEVWTKGDQCKVSDEPNATLWSFLQWRQKLKARKRLDNAQLLTGVVFKGTTIGMAPLEGMCSHENSGGINVDHSEAAIGAAATMAHEIGHNFGMSHDNEGCCVEASPEQGGCVMAAATGIESKTKDHSEAAIGAAATMAHEIGHNFGMSHDNEGCCVEASPEQGGCVMAAATGHPFPRVFSACSKKDLASYFQKGGGMCLFNMPNMKDLVGGKRCGNGFVEDGEECDCGEPEECTSSCCNANNCTLKAEAQCAHGVCCEGCQLKQAGTMCREPAGSCDLPEYCTGASPYCPSNVYLLDGTSCLYSRAYCHNGMCLTHEQQCVQLWGYGAWPAPAACFQDVNAAGNAYGNCGKDSLGNYVKCGRSDAICGKIQCQSAAKKPKGTNAVSIDTTIRFNGREVCRDRRCQNASFSELDVCVSKCHGHGVCNSNKNCHCNAGWAPPFCDKPGLGGSIDSGPVQNDGQQGLVAGLLFAFLVLLPGVLGMFYCWKIKTSPFHKWRARRNQNTQTSRNEVYDQKPKNGHLNPAFHLKTIRLSNKPSNAKKLFAVS
ncbi:UNVERIFIED_CONTAM: hypothetical protein FKN15_064818 [Acipenser sinensis]